MYFHVMALGDSVMYSVGVKFKGLRTAEWDVRKGFDRKGQIL